MEYRKLPRGNQNERFSVLGLGMGGIGKTPADEIEAIIRKAIDNGINFFDLCTAGIDIGLVNKYYDLALAGDRIAANHYTKLSVNAEACLHCGHCESRCPFSVKQESRMEEIANYFR